MSRTREPIVDRAEIILTRTIAKGGMCVVYEGRKLGIDGFEKRMAVKMLRSSWSENERFMKLFVAEAKLVSDLVHENIVQIYQLGRLADSRHYIIMEYVEGITLEDFMAHHNPPRKPIPTPLAVHIVSRIARGLAYAHGFKDRTGRLLNIVHRDVCPRNILLTTEGLAKLTDFGIAKAAHLSIIKDEWLTGKIPFMSPEQGARQAVDFRTDIYSLGAVLFEMLTGYHIRPANADPDSEPFGAIPVEWNRIPKETDPQLLDVMKKMLHPDPLRRFQDTNELARELEICIYKHGYGPTIQTVEQYLRREFPELYSREKTKKHSTPKSLETTLCHGADTVAEDA